MGKNGKPTQPPRPSPAPAQKGYQPRPLTEGYKPGISGGHQPTNQSAPAKPPANPPNTGSGGKK